LDTWLRAEASLSKPAIVGRAASALPTRAALILQALDALQRNDLGRLRALAAEAQAKGAADVAASLKLLGAAPGSETAREAIERARALPGLPLCGATLADALAGVEAARGRSIDPDADSPPDAAPLPADAPPAAAALAALLAATPARPQALPALAARVSARADQVQVAASALVAFGDTDDSTVETYCAALSVLDLDGAGWPDITPDAYAPLVAWCEDPDLLWSADQEGALDTLGFHGDRERDVPYQRLVLGVLLRRIRQSVEAGKLATVLPVIVDIVTWTSRMRAFPTALRQQCAALCERVAWLTDSTPDAAFIAAFWRERAQHLSHEARVAVAELALEAPPAPESDALRTTCASYLVAHLDAVEDVCALVEDHYGESDRAALVNGLRAAKAPAERAAFALGLHAALCGLTAQALDAALAAVAPNSADPMGPTYSVELLVRALGHLQDKTKPLSPSLKRSLGALFDRYKALNLKAPLRLCPPLLLLLTRSSYGLTDDARALIHHSAAAPPLAPPSDLGNPGALDTLTAQVATFTLLDAPEAAEARKVLGRALRKHPDADTADALALRAASLLSFWLPPQPPTLREASLNPVIQFLMRDGDGERAAQAAGRLGSFPPGLVECFLANRDALGRADVWHPLLIEALELPPGPEPDLILKLLADVLERDPSILSSLQLLDALFVASSEHFEAMRDELDAYDGEDDDFDDDEDDEDDIIDV
jgi:hypothetical protein